MSGIHPIEIKGNWVLGYALDLHTVSSQFMGYDEFDREIFKTERSRLGELLYRLKYKADSSALKDILEIVISSSQFKTIDVIVPVPPSNISRMFQPVTEIAKELAKALALPIASDVIRKVKDTPELKNISDYHERYNMLKDVFEIVNVIPIKDKTVLLFDDLYRSGATLNAVTGVLYNHGMAKEVKVLTLTKTRSKT